MPVSVLALGAGVSYAWLYKIAGGVDHIGDSLYRVGYFWNERFCLEIGYGDASRRQAFKDF